MTLSPATKTRNWFLEAAAALLLGTPIALLASPAQADHLPTLNSQMVYPRAGVSSDAYRTATPTATRILREPARLAQTTARPLARTQTYRSQSQIVPVAHRQMNQQQGTSVRDQLQRMYEAEGREMPQMPVYQQPARPAAQQQTADAQAAPAIVPNGPQMQGPSRRQEKRDGGLFAGLFDFGRSSRRKADYSTGGAPSAPPVEPNPYRPPTYRQPQQRTVQQPAARPPAAQQSTAQQQRAGTPQAQPQGQQQQTQTAQSQTRQQTTAQTRQSSAAVGLKRTTPDRNFNTADETFFPEISPQEVSAAIQTAEAAPITTEDFAEFFPEDPAVQAAADTAAKSVKEQMQILLSEDEPLEDMAPINEAEEIADTEGDGFAEPVLVKDDEIIPQPAPAVQSEIVITNVAPTPPPAGFNEPAPFFTEDERAIDPDERMTIAALDGQTFDPSGADSVSTAGTLSESEASGSPMQQIAAREGSGLKGFCAVSLRDHRKLKDGLAAYVSFYHGHAYYFTSADAKARFDDAPGQYAPASNGEDITMKTLTGEVVEGSLDHSVWYKDRLYLFSSDENLKTFMAAPGAMAVTN